MAIEERSGTQVDEPDEATACKAKDEARWKRWDEVLDQAQRRYEEAKRAGTLIPTDEIDRALDEIRGRGE
jgi:hypothetical protein